MTAAVPVLSFRSSSMHRRFACPGSARLEAGLEEEDSDQAREGTLLHSYLGNPKLERAVLKPSQQDLLRASEEIRDFVLHTVSAQFGISDTEPFEDGGGEEWVVKLSADAEISGHTDFWRRYPALNLVVVIDYKTGYKIVEAATSNLQLRSYAVAAVDQWPNTMSVAVAIVQPRLSYSERCTLALYNRDDIEASRAELLSILDASRQPDAPLHAGESQCQYCLAKARCPEFASQLVPLDAGKEIVNALGTLKPEQRDSLIRAVKFAAFIKEPLMDHEREVIAAGGESLYTLGKPKNTREVVDVKRAVALLSLRSDLTRDEAMDACEMHFGALEEKLRLKKGCTWKVARETIEGVLEPVIERGVQKAPLTRKKEVARLE